MTATATAITKARRDAGLSRRELARRAGVCPATINYIEAGERTPSPAVTARIAAAVGVPTNRLAGLVQADIAARASLYRGHSAEAVTCDIVAAVAEEGDTELVLARKLDLAGDRGRRVIEMRIARMRRDLGAEPASPEETKTDFRRAGNVARRWLRRCSELTAAERDARLQAFRERSRDGSRNRSGNACQRVRRAGL